MQTEVITTFFSWQSDIEGQAKFIRDALAEISPYIQNGQNDLKVTNDEATRERPGSPDIILTILDKINKSDVFIADVTLINIDIPNSADLRLTPNPNVMFELGFAVALLGWDRIILLNNNKISSVDSLPFDIKTNRVLSFSAQNFNKSEKGNLKTELKKALNVIIKFDPERNVNKILKTENEIKHERDVRNLRNFLMELDFNSILASLDSMPYRIEDRLAHYFEFAEMYFPYCDLYDKDLKSKFNELFETYNQVRPTPLNYEFNNNINMNYRFYSLNNEIRSNDFFDNYVSNLRNLKNIIMEIKEIVRHDYIEIDLDETNRNARQQYTELFSNSLEE